MPLASRCFVRPRQSFFTAQLWLATKSITLKTATHIFTLIIVKQRWNRLLIAVFNVFTFAFNCLNAFRREKVKQLAGGVFVDFPVFAIKLQPYHAGGWHLIY